MKKATFQRPEELAASSRERQARRGQKGFSQQPISIARLLLVNIRLRTTRFNSDFLLLHTESGILPCTVGWSKLGSPLRP